MSAAATALSQIVEKSIESSQGVLDVSIKIAEHNIKTAAMITDLAQKQAELLHQQTEFLMNAMTGYSMAAWISNVWSKAKP